MIRSYIDKYDNNKVNTLDVITNDEWQKKIKENNINLREYKIVEIWNGKDNEKYMKYKPSNLYKEGEYPFSNQEDNQMTVSFANNFAFFVSSDTKFVF